MKIKNIDRWMFLLMAVLLMACNSKEDEAGQPVEEDCYLDIYVYGPGRSIVTRADVGEINPISAAESDVHSLHIWVFKSSAAEEATAVGYLKPDVSFLSASTPQKYLLRLDKEFVKKPTNVDVYVVANAESCAVSLGQSTTRAELDAAVIGSNYFGTTNLYGENDLLSGGRIATNGLPMSAVLKDQPVFGQYPTLHIGEDNKIATLELNRAVSKLRFVLCRIKEKENTSKKFVSIDGIQLNGGQIPKTAYLMPGTYNYAGNYVSDNSDVIKFVDPSIEEQKLSLDDIPAIENPLVYAYDTQNAQVYENLIDAAVKSNLTWLQNYGTEKNIPELAGLTAESVMPQLKQIGLTYLRESDKQLKGTITYTYKDGEETKSGQTAEFTMAAPGDFLRNHSWIVYIYYMDSKIHVVTVVRIGMKEWVSDGQPESPWFYNW